MGEQGFVFRAFAIENEESYEELIVPNEVAVHLPVGAASSQPLLSQIADEPAYILPADDSLLDDACTLLSYLQNNAIRPTADGGWPQRHNQGLQAQLRIGDMVRLNLLHHVSQALEWLQPNESKQLHLNPTSVTYWLERSTGEQRRTLASAWAKSSEWNDLRHVPNLAFDDTGSWQNHPLSARKSILDQLSKCTPEVWYAIGDFTAAIKGLDPDFQRPGGDYSS